MTKADRELRGELLVSQQADPMDGGTLSVSMKLAKNGEVVEEYSAEFDVSAPIGNTKGLMRLLRKNVRRVLINRSLVTATDEDRKR